MKHILIIIIYFLSANVAHACSCESNVKINYEKSDVVFLGEVIEVQNLCSLYKSSEKNCKSPNEVALVKPYQLFKGEDYSLKTSKPVYLIQGYSRCHIQFKAGHKFVIFAKRSLGDMYFSPGCSGSIDIESKSSAKTIDKIKVLEEIDEAKKP